MKAAFFRRGSQRALLQIAGVGLLVAGLLFTVSLLGVRTVQSAPSGIAGWAWSDTIGWISLNCSNTSSCGTVNYGLSLSGSAVTGYAWSDSVGWIKFGGLSSFPTPSQQRIYVTSGTSWTVPSDWNNAANTVEVLGGGGGGAPGTPAVGGGGGGGGGAYSKKINVTLTPSTSVNINIGVGGTAATAGGDTYFNGASCAGSPVCAKGGSGGSGTSAGAGGALASGIGDTKFSGGAGGGGCAPCGGAGGGGGAAGPNASGATGGVGGGQSGGGGGGANGGNNGTSGSGATGGAGGAGANSGGSGGTGGSGDQPGSAGSTGSVWTSIYSSGGGGGGAGTATVAGYSGAQGGGYGSGGGGGSINGGSVGPGGTGAPGLIVITYTPTTGGTTASDATVSGTNIVGWARACAGTAAGDCSTMTSRSDGWDGWIALSGTGYATSMLGCSSFNCAGNWAWGGDVVGWLSFNITGTAPTVTTDPATGITAVGASLNGTGNPNNAATTGYFRYSATNPGSCDDVFGTRAPASSGSALGSGASGVTFFQNISGLTPGTTYYYCALASSTNGVGLGTVANFTTTNDICTDIAGNQATVPTGCQSPVPPPSGACIPSGYSWNGSQCVPNPAIISSFYASPSRVKAGATVTLFYTVTNPPASCTVRSNAGFGPVTVNPVNNVQGSTSGGTVSNATIYTLTCGSVTASVSVSIDPIYKEI